MKLLSKVNYTTRKHLGSTGRPVTIAAASAAGLYYAGQKWGIELLESNYAIAGFSILITAAVEGTLFLFGSTTAPEAASAAELVNEVAHLKKQDYDNLQKALKDSLSEAEADSLIQFFDVARMAAIRANAKSNVKANVTTTKHKKPEATTVVAEPVVEDVDDDVRDDSEGNGETKAS